MQDSPSSRAQPPEVCHRATATIKATSSVPLQRTFCLPSHLLKLLLCFLHSRVNLVHDDCHRPAHLFRSSSPHTILKLSRQEDVRVSQQLFRCLLSVMSQNRVRSSLLDVVVVWPRIGVRRCGFRPPLSLVRYPCFFDSFVVSVSVIVAVGIHSFTIIMVSQMLTSLHNLQ